LLQVPLGHIEEKEKIMHHEDRNRDPFVRRAS